MPRVERALISVSDKTGLDRLARELRDLGVEILSSGGTHRAIRKAGVDALLVSDVTGFPEIMDGRVKTLHPKIHAGILADRGKAQHMRELEVRRIKPIDLVVVNLYPFEKTVAKKGVTFEEAIENIDIGGPTMVRAAAKNCAHVVVVVNPGRYRGLVDELKKNDGFISPETSLELAKEAFQHTTEYDAAISRYLSRDVEFPESLLTSYRKVEELRYGENPDQAAAFYRSRGAPRGSFAAAKQLHGRTLSYNNLLDGDAAWSLVREFEDTAAVVMKHNNPCGAAVSENLAKAYQGAYDCDPVSAFGSVVGFNREVDEETARRLSKTFVELVVAPSFEKGALEILEKKEDIRILHLGKSGRGKDSSLEIKMVEGGLLLQEPDRGFKGRSEMQVVGGKKPTERQWDDLMFAWRVAKHVRSNAIVLAKRLATVGIGAGQMSRVDAVDIALAKAGKSASGAVMASDAFFPFPDGVERAGKAGISAVIQPGGSMRDKEVIRIADRLGVAMVFTGRRHFRH